MLVVCGTSVRDSSDIIIKIIYAANCTVSFSWRGVRVTADADGELRLQRTRVAAPVIYQLRCVQYIVAAQSIVRIVFCHYTFISHLTFSDLRANCSRTASSLYALRLTLE